MIGDWVQPCSRSYPVQVDFLSAETINDDMDAAFDPIPLTPEILETNGFKVRSLWAEYEDDDCTMEIVGANFRVRNARGSWFKGKCSFVHELQHALRLCGIDKELTL